LRLGVLHHWARIVVVVRLLLFRTPKAVGLLSTTCYVVNDLQLAGADIVDQSVQRQTSLGDRSLDSRMLLEHFK
jgi:hypothetical protein